MKVYIFNLSCGGITMKTNLSVRRKTILVASTKRCTCLKTFAHTLNSF